MGLEDKLRTSYNKVLSKSKAILLAGIIALPFTAKATECTGVSHYVLSGPDGAGFQAQFDQSCDGDIFEVSGPSSRYGPVTVSNDVTIFAYGPTGFKKELKITDNANVVVNGLTFYGEEGSNLILLVDNSSALITNCTFWPVINAIRKQSDGNLTVKNSSFWDYGYPGLDAGLMVVDSRQGDAEIYNNYFAASEWAIVFGDPLGTNSNNLPGVLRIINNTFESQYSNSILFNYDYLNTNNMIKNNIFSGGHIGLKNWDALSPAVITDNVFDNMVDDFDPSPPQLRGPSQNYYFDPEFLQPGENGTLSPFSPAIGKGEEIPGVTTWFKDFTYLGDKGPASVPKAKSIIKNGDITDLIFEPANSYFLTQVEKSTNLTNWSNIGTLSDQYPAESYLSDSDTNEIIFYRTVTQQ